MVPSRKLFSAELSVPASLAAQLDNDSQQQSAQQQQQQQPGMGACVTVHASSVDKERLGLVVQYRPDAAGAPVEGFIPMAHVEATLNQLQDRELQLSRLRQFVGRDIPASVLDAVAQPPMVQKAWNACKECTLLSHTKALGGVGWHSLKAGDLIEATVVDALNPRVKQSVTLDVGGGLLGSLGYWTTTPGGGRAENRDALSAVFYPGRAVKALVFWSNPVTGALALSTKELERQPGDLLRDAQGVFDNGYATLLATVMRRRVYNELAGMKGREVPVTVAGVMRSGRGVVVRWETGYEAMPYVEGALPAKFGTEVPPQDMQAMQGLVGRELTVVVDKVDVDKELRATFRATASDKTHD